MAVVELDGQSLWNSTVIPSLVELLDPCWIHSTDQTLK